MLDNTLQQYKQLVSNKYSVYNSLFMNLPYEKISNIGMLIPILANSCKEGFENGKSPDKILAGFFKRHTSLESEEEQIDFLFRIIQYVERQVVLFDSIEDAAFEDLSKLSNDKTVRDVKNIAKSKGQYEAFKEKLADFSIRIVFTAHPTQFYPPSVQRIIHDLGNAISEDEINKIDMLLQQLGQTSFLNQIKPTPFEEARSIIYYLRNVYYDAIGRLFESIDHTIGDESFENSNLIRLGFWPGGDRDGNPFVTSEITLKVANELRMTLMKCYYNNLKEIRRKLSFKSVEGILRDLSQKLYTCMFSLTEALSYVDIMRPLLEVRKLLIDKNNGLFLDELDRLINRVKIFKVHFATLDVRQDNSVHVAAVKAIIEAYDLADKAYDELTKDDLVTILTTKSLDVDPSKFEDPLIQDTIKNIKLLRGIQKNNGEDACNRYIISNSEDVTAVLNVYGLFKFCGWNDEDISFDIIPLFETMKGMADSENTMQELFANPVYAAHVDRRQNKHTIMLGFSDGTKDGGYLKANWEIFRTKENLTRVCDEHRIKVVFFDGRGGPPARGGGKSHKFYAAQGKVIANNEIQLTIQGQTITSMYGTADQFMHNCEQLITAGVINDLLLDDENLKDEKFRSLMDELSEISYEKYEALKHHPKFISYLENMSTLKYYGKANIGSRPGKRGNKKQLELTDLRAISFVGSWSQLKQNVPGYFGIGTALNKLKEQGRLKEIKAMIKEHPFFKTLIFNSMMSISKSFFPLTAYMENDPIYGEFWKILKDEFELSKAMILEILEYKEVMEEEPVAKSSIQSRENIVLPLITIQQYALQKIAEDTKHKPTYEIMVTRSLFGNINASRNSA